jgi:hypothetical protein
MRALGVLSVVLVAILAPALISRQPDARRGLRKVILTICVFNAVYLIYLTLVHPNVFIPHWP